MLDTYIQHAEVSDAVSAVANIGGHVFSPDPHELRDYQRRPAIAVLPDAFSDGVPEAYILVHERIGEWPQGRTVWRWQPMEAV
jgi:hypothetical protein